MKTLLFHNLKAGPTESRMLINVDSERDRFSLSSGIHLLVAPNGYGKSTFLQTVAGLKNAISGEIRLDGTRVWPDRDVLYISEYLAFPRYITAREWVEFVARDSGTQDWKKWIPGLRLDDLMQTYLGKMSQGERRKTTWLAAVASQKPILLLDEPLDGLDLMALETAREILVEWKKSERIVLIVSHHAADILDLCDQVVWIRDKKLKGQTNVPSDPRKFREETVSFYRTHETA